MKFISKDTKFAVMLGLDRPEMDFFSFFVEIFLMVVAMIGCPFLHFAISFWVVGSQIGF